jgi:amino acid transporter
LTQTSFLLPALLSIPYPERSSPAALAGRCFEDYALIDTPAPGAQTTDASPNSFGLRAGAVSPLETLAQSISSIAPTVAPALTIPAVFGLAGNATWLVYALGACSMVLVAISVRQFARRSASPGSLYEYAASVLPPGASAVAGWALLLAYAGTAAAVTGGFTNYGNALLKPAFHFTVPPVLLTAVSVGVSACIAWRDIKLSARLMLWLEGLSVLLITMVVAVTLFNSPSPFDLPQIELRGVNPFHLGPGLVLAIFSFVGFESATALGAEARDPLRSIPRAVLNSAILAGLFFVVCAYAEVSGFRSAGLPLDQSDAPLQVLAQRSGMSWAGPLIGLGALFSFFSCTLACITAGARVLFSMARKGLLHASASRAHRHNETPHVAVAFVAAFTLALCGPLAALGVAGADVNGWLGTLATYGFIVAYLGVVIAAPIHQHRWDRFRPRDGILAFVAGAFMVSALVLSVNPVPPPPYNYLPYLFAGYLVVASVVGRLNRAAG